ncbi:Spt4/RpoE2 zinc finger-domain-containing protein [Tuber borchii]|uniref:Transcription elongation factor SPT4 n=1 Tax=Tuber borchii TaxID=42251 RepID=A0A2T7A6H2_TUBBO|nr:Spt4/RpoE2 zinc finger-domain-containing protein [Tuber borchii]
MSGGSNFVAPGQYRHLRACMVCSVVQTQQKFIKDGCPNCEDYLNFRGQPDFVDDCTSPVFEGLITLRDPKNSWVAKWQRLDGYRKGVYAVKVSGNLPVEASEMLAAHNIEYRPRDGSDINQD